MRTKASFRGGLVDQQENRAKVFESILERDFWMILRVNRRVKTIDDQPPARRYVTTDGREASHTFDFRATLHDGRRIAYAVKPKGKVEKSGIQETLRQIRRQSLHGFADKAILVTERAITRRFAFNANEILAARSMRNDEDVEVVRGLVFRLQGAVRLAELAQATGLGARGRNAAVCLIDEGLLTLAANAWIKPSALLQLNRTPTQPQETSA